jgi:hypothetical protein
MDALPKTVYVCIDIRWINIQSKTFSHARQLTTFTRVDPLELDV